MVALLISHGPTLNIALHQLTVISKQLEISVYSDELHSR